MCLQVWYVRYMKDTTSVYASVQYIVKCKCVNYCLIHQQPDRQRDLALFHFFLHQSLICEDEWGGLAVDSGFEMSSSLSPRIENVSLCISPSLYDLNTYFQIDSLYRSITHTDSNKDIFVNVSTIFLLSQIFSQYLSLHSKVNKNLP